MQMPETERIINRPQKFINLFIKTFRMQAENIGRIGSQRAININRNIGYLSFSNLKRCRV